MRAKPDERRLARELRVAGMPFKRIAAQLGVSVNSAYRWTKDIELSPEQVAHNLTGPRGPQNPEHIAARAAAIAATARAQRLAAQDEGRCAAQAGNQVHVAGCMLYWAEGAKDRNAVMLANSDVAMVCFFRRFMTRCFGITRERFTLRLNVYLNNGLSLSEVEDYWLAALDLPRSCLRKHVVDHYPTSSSGKRLNKLPYGVCSLRVHDTHIVQHIFGAIQEYAGFDEPRWLDGPPRKNGAAARS